MALQPDARPLKWTEELKHGLLGSGYALEFLSGHDHSHRLPVSRDGLRASRPGEFDESAELVLCVPERPRFHGEKLTLEFWPVKPGGVYSAPQQEPRVCLPSRIRRRNALERLPVREAALEEFAARAVSSSSISPSFPSSPRSFLAGRGWRA